MYIAAVAMLLRFYNLPLKPLHHDEGVNGLFLRALAGPPHEYRYDPANYHGPTLYYAAWLSTIVFRAPTFAIRFVTGLAGLLSVLIMLDSSDRSARSARWPPRRCWRCRRAPCISRDTSFTRCCSCASP